MADSFDAVVIGAGPAGEVAASRLHGRGLRTALVERELSTVNIMVCGLALVYRTFLGISGSFGRNDGGIFRCALQRELSPRHT